MRSHQLQQQQQLSLRHLIQTCPAWGSSFGARLRLTAGPYERGWKPGVVEHKASRLHHKRFGQQREWLFRYSP